jgi:hypothetical protein
MVRTKQINWQQTLRAAKADRNNVFILRHGWNAEFLARFGYRVTGKAYEFDGTEGIWLPRDEWRAIWHHAAAEARSELEAIKAQLQLNYPITLLPN